MREIYSAWQTSLHGGHHHVRPHLMTMPTHISSHLPPPLPTPWPLLPPLTPPPPPLPPPAARALTSSPRRTGDVRSAWDTFRDAIVLAVAGGEVRRHVSHPHPQQQLQPRPSAALPAQTTAQRARAIPRARAGDERSRRRQVGRLRPDDVAAAAAAAAGLRQALPAYRLLRLFLRLRPDDPTVGPRTSAPVTPLPLIPLRAIARALSCGARSPAVPLMHASPPPPCGCG
jgi:hypothetical protein